MALVGIGSVIENLRRDYVHSKDLSVVLELLRHRLGEEGIPFALLGALAAREYGYARYTEDVDLLTTPAGLDRIHERIVGRELRLRAEGLRKSFRDPVHAVDVDVITAGEPAGAAGSPVVYPDPRSDAFLDRDGVRIPTLVSLIEFKIASGVWGNRDQDLVDVQKLIQANHLDESFASRLLPALRDKYLELLTRSRAERRIE